MNETEFEKLLFDSFLKLGCARSISAIANKFNIAADYVQDIATRNNWAARAIDNDFETCKTAMSSAETRKMNELKADINAHPAEAIRAGLMGMAVKQMSKKSDDPVEEALKTENISKLVNAFTKIK